MLINTSLEDFKEEIKLPKQKYTKDYIRLIDNNKIFFNFYDDCFYNVNNYKNRNECISHASLERHINKKVKVINFIRDCREDCWDDGGYALYVGEYNNKFIFGTNAISSYMDFSEEFLHEESLEEDDENIEYKLFDTLEDVQKFIDKIINEIKHRETKKLSEDSDADPEEWTEELYELTIEDFESEFMKHCITNIGEGGFYDYPDENLEKLKNLLSDKYIPRFLDPVEFLDSWCENNDIQQI